MWCVLVSGALLCYPLGLLLLPALQPGLAPGFVNDRASKQAGVLAGRGQHHPLPPMLSCGLCCRQAAWPAAELDSNLEFKGGRLLPSNTLCAVVVLLVPAHESCAEHAQVSWCVMGGFLMSWRSCSGVCPSPTAESAHRGIAGPVSCSRSICD